MITMASQINSLTVVYSIVYSGADQRKHQSSASRAFVRGIHRDRWIPRTKDQERGKCFYLMTSSCFHVTDPFMRWIYRSAVNSPHKWPVIRILMFLWCGSASAVNQTVEWQVISDCMAFMWRHCYGFERISHILTFPKYIVRMELYVSLFSKFPGFAPIHGVSTHRWSAILSSDLHSRLDHTVYPKKYAHGFCFAVLCCGYTLTDFPISIRLTSLALWQSNDCPSASKATLMNMDKYFMWIHYERLHNHNKAKHNKTVCIFLGIYCIRLFGPGTSNAGRRRSIRRLLMIWLPVLPGL